MSDMMSVMKTLVKKTKAGDKRTAAKRARPKKTLPDVFTVRDLNRDTATVLKASKAYGRVTIKGRDGQQFFVQPVPTPVTERPDFLERMRQHRERLRAMGFRGPQTPEEIERVNRIIAGEE